MFDDPKKVNSSQEEAGELDIETEFEEDKEKRTETPTYSEIKRERETGKEESDIPMESPDTLPSEKRGEYSDEGMMQTPVEKGLDTDMSEELTDEELKEK
jgi:hypothetical protein